MKDAIDENEEYFLLNVDLAYAPFDILVDTYNITITDSGELIACRAMHKQSYWQYFKDFYVRVQLHIILCICKGFKDMYVIVEICINNVS